MQPILAGHRVVELGTMLAAPFAAHVLAQLGAEVIKVEPPSGDPTRAMVRGGPSGTFIAYSRGKKSLCLDLKTPAGQRVLHKLVGSAQVVVHNLAPSSTRHLGVGYEDCLRLNPEIIYCHIQGYGSGPLEDRIASNPVIEAATGVMYTHRIDGRPTRLGPSHHDQFAGMYAVIGILTALASDARDAAARRVEVGLYETGLHVAARELVGGQLKAQLGVKAADDGGSGEFSLPGYGAYETADGRWIYLVMLTDAHWTKFCEALALPEAGDAAYATMRQRKKQRAQVEHIIGTAIRSASFDDVAGRLDAAGVGFTEVKRPADVLDEAQARQPGKLQPVAFGGLRFDIPNLPLPRQLGAPADELPPPLLGEHTREILHTLGYADAECAALIDCGAVVASAGEAVKWAPVR